MWRSERRGGDGVLPLSHAIESGRSWSCCVTGARNARKIQRARYPRIGDGASQACACRRQARAYCCQAWARRRQACHRLSRTDGDRNGASQYDIWCGTEGSHQNGNHARRERCTQTIDQSPAATACHRHRDRRLCAGHLLRLSPTNHRHAARCRCRRTGRHSERRDGCVVGGRDRKKCSATSCAGAGCYGGRQDWERYRQENARTGSQGRANHAKFIRRAATSQCVGYASHTGHAGRYRTTRCGDRRECGGCCKTRAPPCGTNCS